MPGLPRAIPSSVFQRAASQWRSSAACTRRCTNSTKIMLFLPWKALWPTWRCRLLCHPGVDPPPTTSGTARRCTGQCSTWASSLRPDLLIATSLVKRGRSRSDKIAMPRLKLHQTIFEKEVKDIALTHSSRPPLRPPHRLPLKLGQCSSASVLPWWSLPPPS